MLRRTSLRRGSALLRRTRMRPRNPARRAKLRARDFGDQADRCRVSACIACLHLGTAQSTPTDPSHHKSRGAGGRDDQCIPLCRDHHDALHRRGVTTFWRQVGLDPLVVLRVMREPGTVITTCWQVHMAEVDDSPVSSLLGVAR